MKVPTCCLDSITFCAVKVTEWHHCSGNDWIAASADNYAAEIVVVLEDGSHKTIPTNHCPFCQAYLGGQTCQDYSTAKSS